MFVILLLVVLTSACHNDYPHFIWSNETATLNEASKICVDKGGQLPNLISLIRNKELEPVASKNGFWIALMGNSGDLCTYIATSEYKDNTAHNRKKFSSYVGNLFDCSQKRNFVCQMPPLVVPCSEFIKTNLGATKEQKSNPWISLLLNFGVWLTVIIAMLIYYKTE